MKVFLVNERDVRERKVFIDGQWIMVKCLSFQHTQIYMDGDYTHVMIRDGDLYKPEVNDNMFLFSFVDLMVPADEFISPLTMMLARVWAVIGGY